MNHNRELNSRINDLHERSLRCVYNDHLSTFSELLKKDKTVTVHCKNLQFLATEMYKIKNGISPDFVTNLFEKNENTRDLRKNSYFKSRKINSIFNGKQSLSFLGPKIWDQVPQNIKDSKTLLEFKNKIKHFEFEHCPCRNCQIYIQGVGFTN